MYDAGELPRTLIAEQSPERAYFGSAYRLRGAITRSTFV
jgi:hypothetical protein